MPFKAYPPASDKTPKKPSHRSMPLRQATSRRRSKLIGPKPAGLEPPSRDDLEAALGVLVDALMAHREQQDTAPPEPFGYEILNVPCEVLAARSVVRDPIRWGLRKAVKRIGELLGARLTFTEMQRLVERVSALDNRRYRQRVNLLDHAFDGVVCADGDHWLA